MKCIAAFAYHTHIADFEHYMLWHFQDNLNVKGSFAVSTDNIYMY